MHLHIVLNTCTISRLTPMLGLGTAAIGGEGGRKKYGRRLWENVELENTQDKTKQTPETKRTKSSPHLAACLSPRSLQWNNQDKKDMYVYIYVYIYINICINIQHIYIYINEGVVVRVVVLL